MNVDFNIINQKGSPAIFSDTYANRPAASYPGRLFISTDTKEIYRDTGTAWEEIAGSGSGNIQGSGTANYVPKFTDTETIGNSQIRDDGTGVGIGVAPSAVYYLDIGGSQRNTLSAAGGFTLRQSGSTIAAYGVYDSSSANAFLFSKDGTTNSIYSVGKIEHKIFDGSSNYFTSEFVTGNWAINSVTDAGFKLDVNGTGRFSGDVTMSASSGGRILSVSTGGVEGRITATSGAWYIGSQSAIPTVILAGGSTALTLASSLAATFASGIGIGAATATTGGIQFPSTAVSSADGNNLDDYEEGTWTPVLRGASIAGIYELSLVNSVYTKIGRQVTASCFVILDSVITGGGTEYAQITGLPFAKGTNQQAVGAVFLSGVDFTADYVIVNFIGNTSTSILYFSEVRDNAVSGDLSIVGFAATDSISFTITYNV